MKPGQIAAHEAVQQLAQFRALPDMTAYMDSLPDPVKVDDRVEKAFRDQMAVIKGQAA